MANTYNENQLSFAKSAALKTLEPSYALAASNRRELIHRLIDLRRQMPDRWQTSINELISRPTMLPEIFNAAHDIGTVRVTVGGFANLYTYGVDPIEHISKRLLKSLDYRKDPDKIFKENLLVNALERFAQELGILNQVREKVRELQRAISRTQQPQPSVV